MKNFFYTLLIFLCINLYGSTSENRELLTNFHMIRNNFIKTMNVYQTNMTDNEPFLEIEPNKEVADVNIEGLNDESINRLIAKRVLDFEGEKVVNNTTEYSKYGITIQTLNWYNKKYGHKYILEKLHKEEAIDIMMKIMENSNIDKIKDPRIRIVIFDTLFNTGPKRAFRIAQKTFNFYNDLYGDGNRIQIDGVLGPITIEKLNSIKKVDLFIQLYTFERLETYKKFKEWDKYKTVWCQRILTIKDFKI